MSAFVFHLKQLLIRIWFLVGGWVRPVAEFVQLQTAQSIPKERQRRALASTVDYVERHLRQVDSVSSRRAVLAEAFKRADVAGDRLVCEFGVYSGTTINQIAAMTPNRVVFGFDSFAGLPERWRDRCRAGMFAMPKLPKVRANVTLVQGWFNESLPGFLKDHRGAVGFLHIDCDLYSSTKIVFDLLDDRLGPGAVIVFDEYFNYPEWEQGEYQAFQEFLERRSLACEFLSYNRYGEQVAVVLRERGTSPGSTA